MTNTTTRELADALARALSAQIALSGQSVCQAQRRTWWYWEKRLENGTPQASREAAARLTGICSGCKFVGPGLCQDLARTSKFTGVAGGVLWENGRIVARRTARIPRTRAS